MMKLNLRKLRSAFQKAGLIRPPTLQAAQTLFYNACRYSSSNRCDKEATVTKTVTKTDITNVSSFKLFRSNDYRLKLVTPLTLFLLAIGAAKSMLNEEPPDEYIADEFISALTLTKVLYEKSDESRLGAYPCNYLCTLCQLPFPRPMTGGSEILNLPLSLVKTASRYNGQRSSTFGTHRALKETIPEAAVTAQYSLYGGYVALQKVPPGQHIQATAIVVQTLLIAGKRKEALQYLQHGQSWGPALVLVAHLVDQYHLESTKQMKLQQLVAGTPFRSLCLLIAGHPVDVSHSEIAANLFPFYASQNKYQLAQGTKICELLAETAFTLRGRNKKPKNKPGNKKVKVTKDGGDERKKLFKTCKIVGFCDGSFARGLGSYGWVVFSNGEIVKVGGESCPQLRTSMQAEAEAMLRLILFLKSYTSEPVLVASDQLFLIDAAKSPNPPRAKNGQKPDFRLIRIRKEIAGMVIQWEHVGTGDNEVAHYIAAYARNKIPINSELLKNPPRMLRYHIKKAKEDFFGIKANPKK